ncbi:hypothetical protein AFLA_007152 [Aspergillus flavus NRRL3357]|nr:hypothetical protein AFLA_007152 [Aspergillus flavus NRRL3357]
MLAQTSTFGHDSCSEACITQVLVIKNLTSVNFTCNFLWVNLGTDVANWTMLEERGVYATLRSVCRSLIDRGLHCK